MNKRWSYTPDLAQAMGYSNSEAKSEKILNASIECRTMFKEKCFGATGLSVEHFGSTSNEKRKSLRNTYTVMCSSGGSR